MAIERLVEPTLAEDNSEEEKIEISLRPVSFEEYIGQEHLKNNIKLAIEAVKKRSDGSTLDHVLLSSNRAGGGFGIYPYKFKRWRRVVH